MRQNPANLTKEDRWVPTTCFMCESQCGIRVHVVDGVVVKIEGNPDSPHGLGRLCAKGNAGIMELYDPHRLKNPVKRTNPNKGIGVDPQWVEISWQEAMDTIAQKAKKIRDEDPRKVVFGGIDLGDFSIFWNYGSAFGTPNVWASAADYYCGNGLHPLTYSAHAAFYAEPDLDRCNYCMLVGTQVGFMANTNANPLAQKMADARMRGMKVVVVDPIGTNAAAKADEWVPIRPGTDAALALGMLNVLLNELGIYDVPFLRNQTNSPYLVGPDGRCIRDEATGKPLVWDELTNQAKTYDAPDGGVFALEGTYVVRGIECRPAFQILKEHVKSYTLEKVSKITTVPAATIHHLAREFGEAARIGSTITIDGKGLPYRPACAQWSKGAIAHKHGMLNGWAIELLNMVVGAIDVPGGLMGSSPVGPFWAPLEGPDGLLVPHPLIACVGLTFPAREVGRPESLDLMELFPAASYSAPMIEEGILNPGKFGLDYTPEMWFQYSSNSLMSTGNPKRMAETLMKVPFVVCLAAYLNETTDLADIVLPDARYLERLIPFANLLTEFILAGEGDWYFNLQQPVVKPPAGVRPRMDILLELADRIGFLEDYLVILNTKLCLKEPYRLDPSKKYTWEEIVDTWCKSWTGAEHGLEYYKEHGFLIHRKKKLEEAYPRPFLKPRIPLYLHHMQDAGEEVRKQTREMGIDWDISDYQPLPDWKPCPSHEEGSEKYDLFAVNYKLPIHTFSVTAQNPWLSELAEHHPYAYKVMIPARVAAAKGIKDGDAIWVESAAGRQEGKAKVTECIHHEVVGIAGTFGGWSKGRPIAKGKGLHFNSFLPSDSESFIKRMDMVSAALDLCVKVRVYKKDSNM